MAGKNVFLTSIALLVLASFLLSGAFGFRTDYKECNQKSNLAERAGCFRDIAITYAAQMDEKEARKACSMVRDLASVSDPVYFNEEANMCYYDVAKMLAAGKPCGEEAKDDICDEIQEYDAGQVISGTGATKKMCKREVLSAKLPQCYECKAVSAFFIVALLFVLRNRVH